MCTQSATALPSRGLGMKLTAAPFINGNHRVMVRPKQWKSGRTPQNRSWGVMRKIIRICSRLDAML